MRLVLIRHGQTPSNVAGALDTGHPGAGLTPLGRMQADAVPAALAADLVHGVYASRLVRTQLTAAPLAQARGLGVQVRDGLEEIWAGDLEMRSETDAVRAYTECLAAWLAGDLDRRMPGGTDAHAFFSRFDSALLGIAAQHDPGDTVVVFSHGAAIRVFTALATALEPDLSTELRLMNTGMALLSGQPDSGWELERWLSEPLGGVELADVHAHDVTGESTEEADIR